MFSKFRYISIKGKGEVVPVLFLTEHHAIEDVVGEWRYNSTHSLTSTLDGGEWSALRPGHFTTTGRAPTAHCVGGCVGSRPFWTRQ
jgi:hypothetical protein